MKKNQPSFSPSMQELMELYDKVAAEVRNTPPPFPQSAQHNQELSPHSKGTEQSVQNPKTSDDVVYTTVTSRPTAPLSKHAARMPRPQTIYTTIAQKSKRLSPIGEENEQTQPVARKGQMPTAKAASAGTRLVLSEEQITTLLQHSRLVGEYQERIQNLCQTVYGNRDALQEKLMQIQKDPSSEEGLSTQMKVVPEGLHGFAGKKMLGIKNGARKQAEEHFPTLCNLIDSYVEAVKVTREDLIMSPKTALPHYEQAMGKEALNKILQNQHSSETASPSLPHDDISERTRQHPMVKRHHAQIQYWCTVVFGKSNLLEQQTRELFENPSQVEELTWPIAESPQSIGSYAGVGVGSLKNRERRHAEAGLSHLVSAMGNYANTVHRVRSELTQPQQTAQQQPEQLGETSQNVQKRQELSQSAKSRQFTQLSESTSPHETAGPSRHTPEPSQDVRPRRRSSSQAMAFAS
ncbi:BID domain-containing T4SS effector [Bartonella raoultii]|uniref:BID domain-containing T4SS effector n=1 Tax=Bartonella raoultii TaxID=1457020 RepID=UPI001ABBA581|nr:BID domain-containing T4SS effector [Bartonella raoultii]